MTETTAPIRILVADDHPLVREGLKRLLELQPGFAVIGEAVDGIEAVERTKQLNPDVLLLDLAMPGLNGIEVLRELSSVPGERRVILLTAAVEREETVEALRLGARGVVLKDTAMQMLYKCIRAVMSGEYWVGRERIADLMHTLRAIEKPPVQEPPPAARLTGRELQIIAAIVEGASNKEVGAQFGVSEQTVKNHLSNIFDKLGVSNRLELALYAVHHRLLARGSEPQAKSGPPPSTR